MFDIGWPELLLIAIVAVVVVGPKDLPRLMATVGKYVARMRSMAAEFQRGFEDIAKQTELEELKKEIDRVGEGDILSSPPPLHPDERDQQAGEPSTGDSTSSVSGTPATNPAPLHPISGERG